MKKFLSALILICLFVLPHAGQAAQTVKVRAGIHDRYDRLVFDWHARVPFTINEQDGLVSIQFTKAGSADFKAVNAVRPTFIRNLSQQSTDKGLLVTFQVPEQTKIESFRTDDGSLAFDVLRMDKAPPKFKDVANAAPLVAKKEPEKKTEETKAEPTDAAQPVIAKPAVHPELQTLADRLAEKPPEAELKGKSVDAPTPTPPPAEPIKGTVIRLNPDELTKLAVFVRAGKLWIVLDKPLESLTPVIEGENVDALSKNARRIGLTNAAAFTFDAPAADTNYTVRRQNNQWQVWMNGDKPYLPDNVTVNVDDIPQVTLYAGENPSIVSLKDKQIGDRLWVVPMRTPEGRIISLHTAPDYQILPSLMGAVIVPLTDAVKISVSGEKVILSADTGKKLSVSNDEDRKRGVQESSYIPMFNLNVENLPDGTFTDKRKELETRLVAKQSPDDKAKALLDLARLDIAYGFGPEAIGALRIAKDLSATMENSRDFQALHGMASALSGDIEQAKKDLSNEAIQSQPAARLWLGYTLANHQIWEPAHTAFIESGNIINSMPDRLKPRLLLAQAETDLMANDLAETARVLKKVPHDRRLTPSEKAAEEYIESESAAMAKDKEGSVPGFEKLVKGPDRLYKVRANIALTKQQLEDKEIELPEAIKRFERLRFDWRNDRLEIDILRQLGQYYVDNKQYMEGLDVWRQAAGLSKISEDTDGITTLMQKLFAKLYVDNEADKMSPIQAVALFDRFRELTPSGDAGNIALAHLADRLAAVDLLDQADALLEKQLLQSAKGEDAAKIGAKLASWRIMNHNASGALKALDESTQDARLPDSLSQKRLLLRAKALADLKRTDEALTLLNTLQSPEAYSLRADIAWSQNRWSDSVDALQPLVAMYRDEGKTAIDGPMPSLILKMAIAMSLDDNKKGMELLKAQYGDFIATTDKAQAFNLITNPAGAGSLADMDTMKKQVGEVELFQKFLKDFGS